MSDDDEKRTRPVSFMLATSELERLEHAAAAEGLSIAGYCRRLILTNLARAHFDRLMSA